MLTEVINGGVNSFNRLLHPVAHVHDNGILHTVGLTRLFVCQFQVIVTLAQHISQLSDMCDMLSDALLHLSESVLHIAHLIVPMALFHWGIKLSFCHLAGCIYQLLQRFQLEMADKETEQAKQQQADKADDDCQPQQCVIRTEDVTLRTNDRHAPPGILERMVEDKALLIAHSDLIMSDMASLHGDGCQMSFAGGIVE